MIDWFKKKKKTTFFKRRKFLSFGSPLENVISVSIVGHKTPSD